MYVCMYVCYGFMIFSVYTLYLPFSVFYISMDACFLIVYCIFSLGLITNLKIATKTQYIFWISQENKLIDLEIYIFFIFLSEFLFFTKNKRGYTTFPNKKFHITQFIFQFYRLIFLSFSILL